MACLQGLIKLAGCQITEVSGAVYSLNSLPGISLKSFEQVANSEQVNYLGVWDAINERAEARIKNQIISAMSTRYDIKRVRRTVSVTGQPEVAAVSDNVFKGMVFVQAWTLNENWVISPFQTLQVDRISFYKSATNTVTTLDIKFVNYITKEVLFTKTLTMADLSTGWNEISILKEFNAPLLAIGFEDKDVNGVTYQTADVNANFQSCFYECYGVDGCGYIYGFAENNGNYVQNQTINSLRATVTLGCSYNAAVCNNRLLFAEAFWYLLGIEFLEERLYSERVNFYTSIKREEAKELISLYNARYEEALKNALGGLKFECDACLECNSLVQVFSQIP